MRVTPVTWIVEPETATGKLRVAVVYPAAVGLVEGVLHPPGTETSTSPLKVPWASAV